MTPHVFMLLCTSLKDSGRGFFVGFGFVLVCCFVFFSRSKPEGSVLPEAALGLLTCPRHCRDGFQQCHHSGMAVSG